MGKSSADQESLDDEAAAAQGADEVTADNAVKRVADNSVPSLVPGEEAVRGVDLVAEDNAAAAEEQEGVSEADAAVDAAADRAI